MVEFLDLPHAEWARGHRNGSIQTKIHYNAVGNLIDLVPSKFMYRSLLLKALAIISPPSGLVLLFLTEWWVGALVIVGSVPLARAAKRSAEKAVRAFALQKKDFYNAIKASGVLVLTPRPQRPRTRQAPRVAAGEG